MTRRFKNRMKKILMAFLIVAGMGLTVPLYAQETDTEQTEPDPVTLKIDQSLDDHTFAAYQIFTGDVDGITLSNVQWGDGVDKEKLIGWMVEKELLQTGETDAKDVAEAIAQYTEDGTDSQKAREVALSISKCIQGDGISVEAVSIQLTPGYYLIVDTTTEPENDTGFVWNETLLQLTSNMTIHKKLETPTVEKKVQDGENYQDIADHSIGDTVHFKYESKVPDTSHYTKYQYIFHDKLSKGLTLNTDSIMVSVGNDRLSESDYTVTTTNEDGCSFHVQVPNLKGKDDQTVKVEYSATLTNEAFVGLSAQTNPGNYNTNSVYLEYSNHPYDDTQTGKTPEDEVVILTYKLTGTKKDAGDKSITLKGAQFKLLNSDQTHYAIIENGKFAGWTKEESSAGTLTSNENGEFEIQGLDAGTYYLKEIKAPTGYNIMEKPQQVVVSAMKAPTYDSTSTPLIETSSSNDSASEEGTVHVDQSGTANVTVYNGKGFTMPQTGAVGQSLIYGAGAVLALGGLGIRIIRHRKEE